MPRPKKILTTNRNKSHTEQIAKYFKKRNILIVEDRPNFRRTIRIMLRVFGIPPEHIEEAGTGEEALTILSRTNREYFLLLDLYLPKMSGVELLKEMSFDENMKNYPAVLITADNHESMVGHAFENGARGYIIKPFTETTLREKLINIIDPPSYLILFEEVESLLLGQRYQKVIDKTQEILRQKPGSPGAYALMGEAYEGLKMDREALRSFERAHSAAPIYLRVIKKLSNFHIKRKQSSRALYYLELADQLNPYNPERKLSIGKVFLNEGRAKKAEHAFDQAITLAPETAQKAAESCGELFPRLAEKYYLKALEIKKDIITINQLGIVLRAQGKWMEAIDQYKTALGIAPQNEGIYFNMGRAYGEGKKNSEALACFQQVLKINSNMKEARNEIDKLLAIGAKPKAKLDLP